MKNYEGTLKIDENFHVDEKHNLFRYHYKNHTEILPARNIISCEAMADIFTLDKSLFHIEEIEVMGSVPFVNDMKEFSKAVLKSGVLLTIFFYNSDGILQRYKKRYSAQDKEVYNIIVRINKLTDK